MVADAGADLLGLNFYPETPRYLEPLAARDLVSRLRDQLGSRCPVLVGVFVNYTSRSSPKNCGPCRLGLRAIERR